MRIRYIPLLLIFLMNVLMAHAVSALDTEYTDLENLYLTVEQSTFQNLLDRLKPSSPEEKAFVSYYKAKMISDPNMLTTELNKTADLYPKTEHGQKACLDLGMRYFLQRDMNKSLAYLLRVTNPTLTEKDYWLTQIYLKQNENGKALLSGQAYLKTARNLDQIENTYYFMANAYINQRNLENVQILLSKLDNIPNLPKHKVYYNYLRGYAYDLAGNDDKALEYYKSIYKLDRYSQFAFYTEERLFAMKARKKNRLDISFIYPDSVYHPPVEMPDTSKTIYVDLPIPGEVPSIETVPDSITMIKKTGHGIFLQLGRFQTEQNAQNLMIKLKDDNFNAFYFPSKLDGKVSYRVLMGPYKTKALAEKMKTKLNAKTYGSIIVTR